MYYYCVYNYHDYSNEKNYNTTGCQVKSTTRNPIEPVAIILLSNTSALVWRLPSQVMQRMV